MSRRARGAGGGLQPTRGREWLADFPRFSNFEGNCRSKHSLHVNEHLRVLLFDRDIALAQILAREFGEKGHVVIHEMDASTTLIRLHGDAFDACIVDVGQAGLEGYSVLLKARALGITTPVIFISTLTEVGHRVEALGRGADDYLVKPFAPAELRVRTEALARRGPKGVRRLTVDTIEIDLKAHRAWLGDEELQLSRKQFGLLEYFLRHIDHVVTRVNLLEHVFGYEHDPGTNLVDVHVANLRRKIAGAKGIRIASVRGIGYRMERVNEKKE